MPSKPLFVVAGGWGVQGVQRQTYPCDCWEETKQGYTVAYGRCAAHAEEPTPEVRALQPKPKKRKKRRRGRRD